MYRKTANQVTDLAIERNKMVFAHGEHFDVFDNNHSVAGFVEHSIIENVCNMKKEHCFAAVTKLKKVKQVYKLYKIHAIQCTAAIHLVSPNSVTFFAGQSA